MMLNGNDGFCRSMMRICGPVPMLMVLFLFPDTGLECGRRIAEGEKSVCAWHNDLSRHSFSDGGSPEHVERATAAAPYAVSMMHHLWNNCRM